MGRYKNRLVEFIESNECELMGEFIEQYHSDSFHEFCVDSFDGQEQSRADALYDSMKEEGITPSKQ